MSTFREIALHESISDKKSGKRGSVNITISLNRGFVSFNEIDKQYKGDYNTIAIKHFKDESEAKKVFDLLKVDMSDREVLKYLDKP